MQPEVKQYTTKVGAQQITLETGKLAAQAGGAVTIRLGDSMVFAAATMSPEPKEGLDYFPLTVEYEERMYAGGRIPGSFFRREGRPSTEAILTSRLTDRPLRPLFNNEMRNDVQVIMFSISADTEHPLDILCINAASAALMISDIPWAGPVGAVRVGRIGGEFIANPTYQQIEESELDLRIAGTRDAILMVECGAEEIPENVMVDALMFGHKSIQPMIDLQEQMAAEVGKTKREVQLFPLDGNLKEQVSNRATGALENIFDQALIKTEHNAAIDDLQKQIVAEFSSEDESKAGQVKEAFEEAYKHVVRLRILEHGKRPDGRGLSEIRPIWCEVGISPRAHGSGLFTRGQTQVLTMATLGTPKEAQELDSLSPARFQALHASLQFPALLHRRSKNAERAVTA